MDVYILTPMEYQRRLQNTLEMPNFRSWTYGKDGFTYYRYLGGQLQARINGQWLVCKPGKDGAECTQSQ